MASCYRVDVVSDHRGRGGGRRGLLQGPAPQWSEIQQKSREEDPCFTAHDEKAGFLGCIKNSSREPGAEAVAWCVSCGIRSTLCMRVSMHHFWIFGFLDSIVDVVGGM